MSDFSFIPPTSVVTIPGAHASAAFTSKTSEVFKEEYNIAPIIINDKMKYIPWGGDNQMPYNIIDLIESDETMSTCQLKKAHKPVVVSMGGYAASGGYYISCGADYIFAEPTTITGSIGIFVQTESQC